MYIVTRRLQRHLAAATSLVGVGAIGVLAPAAPAAASSHTTPVGPRQSIQAVLDSARPGDSVVVRAGVYREQLVVTKDRVSLIGRSAVLRPPSTVSSNICSGLAGTDSSAADTQAGICVTGTDVALAPFDKEHRRFISADHRVDGVMISGFRVEGSSGPNIAFVAAAEARLQRNHHPAGYRRVAAVVITDEDAPAPASDNTVRNNRLADNTLDILVDSTGTGNILTHNHCTPSQPAGLCGW